MSAVAAQSAAARVAVIGAGVIGLSTAVCLSETYGRQLDITVIADKFSPNTTSDRAGASIEPYVLPGIDTSKELNLRWASATFDLCHKLHNSVDRSDCGVHLISGYKIDRDELEFPFWKDLYPEFKVLTRREAAEVHLPVDNYRTFWYYTTYFLRGKFYLPWLLKRFQQYAGIVQQKKVSCLSDLQSYDVIINCTGLGARELVGDKSVFPYRGQVVILKNNLGLNHFYAGNEDSRFFTQVYPYEDIIILGGTYEADNYSTAVDLETTREIVRQNTELVPAIQHVEIVDTWACLRPFRPTIRLEVEQVDPQSRRPAVIHNYGHGGQGWTLHWGCAQDVTALVRDVLAERGIILSRADL